MTQHAMDTLRALVLRWNKNFSLVSRLDPEHQVDELIEECLASGRVLQQALAEACPGDMLRYVDLGTGGGFPGLIWHDLFSAPSGPIMGFLGTDLVEPRVKRAWFLDQAVRAMALDRVDVREQRWDATIAESAATDDPDVVIISMKALDLSDEQVLEGWRAFRFGLGRG
jgi:16S rRNA G527 N7-methylase RsmG